MSTDRLKRFWAKYKFEILAGVTFPTALVFSFALVFWGWWVGTEHARLPVSPISPLEEPVLPLHRTYLPLVMRAELPVPKKGVANTYGACGVVQAIGARYQYGWGPTPVDCGPGVEDIPMVWDRGIWEGVRSGQYQIGGDSPYLMGFNEPDLSGQANLSPAEAAPLWHEIEAAFPDRLLVSPAPSHIHPQWLGEMRDEYYARYGSWPRFDVVAAHCYGGYDKCVAIVDNAVAKCKAWDGCREIWLTEFAHWPDWCASCGIAEMGPFVYYLEQNPKVGRYFWFASLIKNDGTEWWWYGGYISPMTSALGECTEWQGNICLGFELTEFGWWYMIAHTWVF